ncbi:hypothetical protein MC885_006175 [Smutsia gigantea]|nr:hypothetical protein MC885_006175 [Smutsia gigantea]
MSHIILLVQPTKRPEGITYADYESVNECMEAVCKMYEEHLKRMNPNSPSITYDISQLFDFIDDLQTSAALYNFGLQQNLAAVEFKALHKIIQIGSSSQIVGPNMTANKYTQGKMSQEELMKLLQFSDIDRFDEREEEEEEDEEEEEEKHWKQQTQLNPVYTGTRVGP